jgi:hypothetical protein
MRTVKADCTMSPSQPDEMASAPYQGPRADRNRVPCGTIRTYGRMITVPRFALKRAVAYSFAAARFQRAAKLAT